MNKQVFHRSIYVAAGTALFSMAHPARAQISITGSYSSGLENPLAIQTNDTGFGKSGDNSGNSPGGSELDAAYGIIQNQNLILFLTGNLQAGSNSSSYNNIEIFISDGRPGQSTLNAQGSLGAMDGSKFSPGFQATYALDINGSVGSPATEYVNSYDLTQAAGSSAASVYLGSFPVDNAAANTVGNSAGNLSISFNNSNFQEGVAAAPGSTNPGDGEVEVGVNASSGAATTVSTGLEVAIPLTLLGSPKGSIEVLADINGGNNGYLSNQFLPGLPTASGNVGYNGGDSATNNPASPYSVSGNQGAFNFSNTAGQFFTVAGVGSNGTNQWNTGSGSWSTAANWLNDVVPTNPGDTAIFSYNASSPVVTLDGNHSVGQLTFNSSNSYTITQGANPSGGILTIDDTNDPAGADPLITVLAGTHTISAPMNMANGMTVTTSAATALSITNTLGGAGPINKTGVGNLMLSGSNTFSGNINILNGSVELDNPAASSGGIVFIGDGSADGVFASLNLGVSGMNIPTEIVTNPDDSGLNNQRSVAGTFNSGSGTFSGAIYLDGGLSLYTKTGTTLNITGVIANGQNGQSVAKHDVTINAASGGTIILTNAETYTGFTIVNSGILTLSPTASLASPAVYVNGTLNFAAQNSGGILARTLPGTLTINNGGLVTVSPSTSQSNRQVLLTNGFTIAGSAGNWTGKLDLANNDLVVHSGSLFNLASQAGQGYAGGTWNGTGGIVSSTLAASTTHLTALGVIQNSIDQNSGSAIYSTFDGQAVINTDVLVKYTYYGDTDLSGVVDGTDYSRIDTAFFNNHNPSNPQLTGWFNGDFNYDNVIDGSDYTLIDNTFNNQGAALSTQVASPTAMVGGSAVPEPASLSLLGIGTVSLLSRRRRCR